jgi:hypothetical protein
MRFTGGVVSWPLQRRARGEQPRSGPKRMALPFAVSIATQRWKQPKPVMRPSAERLPSASKSSLEEAFAMTVTLSECVTSLVNNARVGALTAFWDLTEEQRDLGLDSIKRVRS